MKKIFFILALFLVPALAANAFVDNKYMTTAQYMQNTGYSAEMENMINVTAQDPYREPYQESNSKKDIAKRVYNYLVPGVYSNMNFYNHNGNYDNPSWRDL